VPNTMTEYRSPLGKKRGTPIKHFDLDAHNYGPAGLAFDAAGNMYVPTQNGLEVYQPHPWKRAFTIKASVNGGCLAFDPKGNLYVTTDRGRLVVFSPPFSAASMPKVTLHLPGRALDAGVAIGP
jgi:sugar lactone lactonase YvrE